VRRALARASEFVESPWPVDVELSTDPVEAAWQLAGIAPIGEIDQVTLLRSSSVRALLLGLIDLTLAAGEVLSPSWQDGEVRGERDDDSDDGDETDRYGLGG
jgi:hypothetical protein